MYLEWLHQHQLELLLIHQKELMLVQLYIAQLLLHLQVQHQIHHHQQQHKLLQVMLGLMERVQ
jgi:hypothetical protein